MSKDNCDGWRDKLLGKIILEDDQETTLSEGQYVRKKDLPKPHRVLKPNSMMTMDYNQSRLNVHVNNEMKVTGVNYG